MDFININKAFINHPCYKDKISKELYIHILFNIEFSFYKTNIKKLIKELNYNESIIIEAINKLKKWELINIQETLDYIIFIENNNYINIEDSIKIEYELIKNLFNNICLDLPKVSIITKKRKMLLNKLFNKYTKEDFQKVFEYIDENNFYSGRGVNSWNNCNFDWIIKFNNFIKIIEKVNTEIENKNKIKDTQSILSIIY